MTEDDLKSERKKLGKRIKAIRNHRGMNLLELSVETGIDKSDLSKYEKGLINLGIDSLKRISFALQVENHDLMNYDGPLPDNTTFKSSYPEKSKKLPNK